MVGSPAVGTENIYKIYAESLIDQAHLEAIVEQAKVIVDDALVICR
jgi:phosphoglucomutase